MVKMNKENSTIYLTSLVAIGIIFVGSLATFLHSIVLAPIVILGIILLVLILLTNRGHFAHTIENLEKIVFFITFLVIVFSFILIYRPI